MSARRKGLRVKQVVSPVLIPPSSGPQVTSGVDGITSVLGASFAFGAVCSHPVCWPRWSPCPLRFVHFSGFEESGPGKAEYREMSSGDHRVDQETRPSLPAGFQRPEWNCKYHSITVSKSLTKMWPSVCLFVLSWSVP